MTPARLALPLLAAALAACGGVRPLQGRPSGRDGWLVYGLRDLRFEAPATWHASGDDRRVALEAPGGGARLEISIPEQGFANERTCLAAAEEKLGAQQGTLERARRHPTRFGGRPAQTLEADQRGWHVWALAACDGGVQYRVFFTAATPAPAEAIETWRTLLQSARLGGEV
ncbi:MAG TPA: hypothetical protein VF894_16390 [Anaeromyxobacter sp.]